MTFCRRLQLERTRAVLADVAARAERRYRRRQTATRRYQFTDRQIQIAITAIANTEARATTERNHP